jgi:serine/threonine protein kinase
MKVLRKDNVIKRKQVEHTNTERRVLGYTKHPFIVGLHYAFQTKENLYFVLDYCAGGELFFHLGRLGRFRCVRVCMCVTSVGYLSFGPIEIYILEFL